MSENENILSKAVLDVIKKRRSVRHFSSKRIPENVLDDIISAGVYAPSGSNSQNQRFMVLTDREALRQLDRQRYVWPYPSYERRKKSGAPGVIANANVAILVFADAKEDNGIDNGEYYIWHTLDMQNCAASIQNMLIMATAHKVGSVWISATPEMNRSRVINHHSWAHVLGKLGVPEHFKVQGMVLLGYPAKGCDENGFPLGENMHGARRWATTERADLKNYLIDYQSFPTQTSERLNVVERLLVGLLIVASHLLIKIVSYIDKKIYNLEVRK